MKAGRQNKLFVGTQFPDGEQSIGESTIAQITFGDLLEAMADGGEFDQLNIQAFLVFVYTLWEESTRHRIAALLHVKKCKVKCDLFGDLRLIRNSIVHKSEETRVEYCKKAILIPELWPSYPNDETFTASMVQALMEQLKAVQVYVGDV